MVSFSIYLVDDDPDLRELLELALETNYRVRTFGAAGPAIEAIKDSPPDLVLLDVRLPDIDGIDALGTIKTLHPEIMVIMITASRDVDVAISAMKLGAYDYFMKPLEIEALEISIRNALDKIRLRKEVQGLQETYLKENIPCFIGESDAIQDVMEVDIRQYR